MNARKVLFVLGGIIIAVVAAVVAFSLFTIQKMVDEKNRKKTAPARANRWAQKPEAEASNLTVTTDGIVEQPKPEDNEGAKTEDEQQG